MTWTERTKPTTTWAKVQIGGLALTWTECGLRSLTWGSLIDVNWSELVGTEWTDRTKPTTTWT